MAGEAAVMVDMSMLYEVADGVTPSYSATSDMPDVLNASASGTMLTLTPMSAGNAMIMVEAIDSGSQSIVSVMYDAMVAAAGITYMLSGPEGEDDEPRRGRHGRHADGDGQRRGAGRYRGHDHA